MPIEILMPALSPTMKEGNLVKWLKNEGDKVKPGDVIAEIETDKATMEVESIDEGVLGKIIVPAGSSNVSINSLIAIILEEGENPDSIADYQPKKIEPVSVEEKNTSNQEIKKPEIINVFSANEQRIKASPLAKRIAKIENIDLSKVTGTGPYGRIVKDDLLNTKFKTEASTANMTRNLNEHTLIPNSNMRKVIAKRLLESKNTIPHFYLFIECNMDKLTAAREEINAGEGAENKVSVNDLVIKASAMALRDVPEANSSWSEEAIILYNNVDVSVAVAIEGGLITPIIKNADQKSVKQISQEMKSLAKRAKENSLKPEEFQGGSFSISNLGMYGIKKFNAIINPPQSCILAVGASSRRPVIVNEQVQISTIMDVSLSCDHRVVDGAVGAKFLAAFKKYIENPLKMLA